MRQCHSSMLHVIVAILAVVLMPSGTRAESTADDVVDKITQLNKDAIAAYQGKNYEDARRILNQALDSASSAELDKHPIVARTHIHLGIVLIVGFSQRDLGIEQFKKALEVQPEIKLTRVLVTPALTDAFAEAKGEGKAGGAAPPGTPPPAPSEIRDTNETTPAAVPAAPIAAVIPAVPTTAPAALVASPPPVESGTGGLAQEAVTEAKQVDRRYFVGLMVGAGFGWATGQGDTNADVALSRAGLAPAGVGQFGPEVGYWMTSSLMLSGQLRYEYITGTTDVYATSPVHTYHTANYALALFAKATWKYGNGEGRFHPIFSLAAGGGRIRHVVSFRRQNLTNCGPNRNQTCVDTIGAGPVLLGPGAGVLYDVSDRAALVVQINSALGFPTFTVNLDANVGVAFGF